MKIISTLTMAQDKLIYRLVETTNETGERDYGISVTSMLFGSEDTETVTNISSNLREAEKLLYILADNTVLPSVLKEIIEDYIAAESTV